MFPQKNRLTKQKDIDLTFKKGKSAFSLGLGIKSLANKLERNRFTAIISNKISKKAVERNKIKRRIRNVLQEQNSGLKQGFDIIIITNPKVLELDIKGTKKTLEYLLNKLSLYNEKKK